MTGSKWADHWSSGTLYECSEIAGSPHVSGIGNISRGIKIALGFYNR
jgi:hypothetical protein